MNASKIIKGVVGGGRYTVTAPIVKEDYGLYLKIEGLELPSTYEVDFSNSEHSGTSVTMIGNADGVLIPSQFISSGKDVFAFLYHVGADYGRTVYKFRIPNKVRPDRTDETPTPEEQSVIDQTISALNTAVAQTAQDVIDADASAQSAQGYAEQAETARDTAQGYATQAQTSANSASASASQASASATASANSASQSAQIKADVEELVDDAQASADASAQSATASANSASQTQGYAQSASASAQSASGYASNAQSSAQTASSKASEASQSATTAAQKATESAQSASQALTYKTDAESAKTASQTAQGLAESARDSAVSAKNDAESAKADAESARDEAQQAVESISGALADKAPVITDTASGSIASFSDGADDLPLKSLVVDINPIQDLSHGDPSPENICPISGWTQIGVEQRGVNLWDEEWEKGTLNASTGAEVKSNLTMRSKNFIRIKPGMTCIAVGPYNVISTNQFTICYYDKDRAYVGYRSLAKTESFVVPSDERIALMRFAYRYYLSDSGGTYNNDVSVNYPSTDQDYHPYTGRSITIDLGQTVYGGHLDVLSGELVIDRAMVDLGTANWWKSSTSVANTYRYASPVIKDVVKIPSSNNVAANIVCTSFPTTYNDDVYTAHIGVSISITGDVNIYDPRYDQPENTTAEFKAAMDGVILCYEVANPIEIQLTPQQINSLLGVNNLWADSGDCTAEYRADTKLFIERLTAPDSVDMIADANITSGQYFMVGNSLYKATANIANGGQIIVGTNATRLSLAQALNEINA